LPAATSHVEKYFFQRLSAVTLKKVLGRIVVLDTALLHDDDALAQTFDFAHVVGGE
jgi:hypothetical protein